MKIFIILSSLLMASSGLAHKKNPYQGVWKFDKAECTIGVLAIEGRKQKGDTMTIDGQLLRYEYTAEGKNAHSEWLIGFNQKQTKMLSVGTHGPVLAPAYSYSNGVELINDQLVLTFQGTNVHKCEDPSARLRHIFKRLD